MRPVLQMLVFLRRIYRYVFGRMRAFISVATNANIMSKVFRTNACLEKQNGRVLDINSFYEKPGRGHIPSGMVW